MLKHVLRLAGLTTLVGVMLAPSAHAAQVRVGVQIGAPPVYAAPPRPVYGARVDEYRAPRGYVWQQGYYVRTPYGPRWVRGAWVVRGHVPQGHAYGYWRNRGVAANDRGWRR